MLHEEKKEVQPTLVEGMARSFSRRKFFGIMGAGTVVMVSAASCKKDTIPVHNNTGVDLGSGDIGILNYAYALEQLEAAFYTQVIKTPFSGIKEMEMSYLKDIMAHEIAHREFFKAALASKAIQDLEVDFSKLISRAETAY
jgi:hypothetical protein